MADPEQGNPQETMLRQWQALKTQAENGEISMDSDLGEKLRGRCEAFIARLENMLIAAGQLKYVGGFGTLKSAEALRTKFANKAEDDPDSAANRLKMSIDIVVLMKETFELSSKQIKETDQSTSTALGNAGA